MPRVLTYSSLSQRSSASVNLVLRIVWELEHAIPFIFTQGLPQDVCYATFFQRQDNLIACTETFEIILKVSKSRKEVMKSRILTKKWTKLTQDSTLSVFCSFFGRIRGTIICFWNLLTFRWWNIFRARIFQSEDWC